MTITVVYEKLRTSSFFLNNKMNSLNGNELFMDNREEINQIFQWLRNN
jgi:hypothetical protein